MTTANREREYDHDVMYGEGEEDLQPLERGMMSFKTGGEDGGSDEKYPYSRIVGRQAEIKFDALYDFIKDYLPKAHRTRVLANGLVRLCQNMLNAPANRRQLRFEVEELKAKYWAGRLSKDKQDRIERADELLDRWGSADLLQIEIRLRRIRHGLEAVEHERARYHTATRKKELLEQMATRLPQPAYEYFQARREQYNIQRELAEDRARGIPAQDFSNLIRRIQDGKATEAEILMDSPWPFYEAFDVCVQEADVDNPHWDHIRQLQSAAARAQQGRRRNNRYGPREDGGGEDA